MGGEFDLPVSTICPPARARRFPIGAERLPGGGVHFRVWAPDRARIAAVFEPDERERSTEAELTPEGNGYFSGWTGGLKAGALYRFRLDHDAHLYPDPASRFQPEGPHGSSQVVDGIAFRWSDANWRGVTLVGQVIYEMHIGTFTSEGTWAAAANQLEELAHLGVTLLEIMPVADFPGRFGWGYDGVNFFAPSHLYGSPDDFRRFVDTAHRVGLGVILDVVYNHAGPDGNYLYAFSGDYFTGRYQNDWGEPFNFDDARAGPVREFVVANACYWIAEFHLDGLRLDATQSMHDSSAKHIIAELTDAARAAAGERSIIMTGENEPQQAPLVVSTDNGGGGLDAIWNDDFHHAAIVALTGRNEAYYSDYLGAPQEFISSAKFGYLYQGQHYSWQKKARGTPTFGLPPAVFINFIENHDQLANSADGHRVHQGTSPGRYRAMTALLLLLPGTPMLFQGQEFCASTPFLYFVDHKEDLKEPIRRGRADFLRQFPSLAVSEMQDRLADPFDIETFARSKLDFAERKHHAKSYQLHKDLLGIRRGEKVFRQQRPHGLDGAVIGGAIFLLRFFGDDRSEDRLLVVNLGLNTLYRPSPEPLIAPPKGMVWELLWSSDSPAYGGLGTPPLNTDSEWRIPGEAAIVLYPKNAADA